MRVFLFGATGPTGQLLLQKLVEKKYDVTVLARRPEAVQPTRASVTVVPGDVMRPETFSKHLAGADIVISALGTGKSLAKTTLFSDGGRMILETMRQTGVQKLIAITSGGVQDDDPTILKSWFYRFIGRWLLRNLYDDMRRFEQQLDSTTDINWVCVRPTTLTNGPATGRYRVSVPYSPEGGSQISRADVADFIIQQILSDQYVRQKPILAY
ncbi:NAD-dependent epimerase/dehydratase family protein [Fibrisoma montanum]|uniref:NAD-dependent epimerase/dehydratase family protein n=1 Tax=Fibrisoma montanum TaxID=2305895 RepID=A0A418M6L7_9BACT|nr:SDR family oxidoreductase [Fibrisoma montanum]RIV21578.1 NAD-dependent epimerase/dehydratase family protein [Fibrisoma montanum]